jgi:hypothetical protein
MSMRRRTYIECKLYYTIMPLTVCHSEYIDEVSFGNQSIQRDMYRGLGPKSSPRTKGENPKARQASEASRVVGLGATAGSIARSAELRGAKRSTVCVVPRWCGRRKELMPRIPNIQMKSTDASERIEREKDKGCVAS